MNITKEDYLKAKNIVKQYEKENKKHIGVICFDRSDYFDYIYDLVTNDLYKFYKISKVNDLCSLCLDDYAVTQLGDQNSEFEEIMKVIKFNLKPKK